ncbi:MAG: multiheme c-type cytochrome [Leptospiraceae bacterium]|nr:multiheme c-type cytochrome [Leptospiraceae bacterium]
MNLLLFYLLLLLSCREKEPIFSKGVKPVVTGLETLQSLSSKECLGCHKEVHPEEDMHSKSWIDPLFQKAFSIEKRDWCIHCHAPLVEQKKEFFSNLQTKSLLEEGINCVSCHVREGKVLGSMNFKNEYHEVVLEERLNKSEFCAGCHQFNFPIFANGTFHYSEEPMQNTYEEWKNFQETRTCQSCHYKGHKVLGTHNRLEKDFYDLALERDNNGLLFIEFHAKENRAHNLPTGDLFHSIQLELSHDSKYQKIFYKKKWARFYGAGKNSLGSFWNRSQIKNSSITPNEIDFHITVDDPMTDVYARLVYYFHDDELGGKLILSKEYKEKVLLEKKLFLKK